MAVQKKIIDVFLDENGNQLPISGAAVADKETGKTFTDHLAEHKETLSSEDINELIVNGLKQLQTTLNAFLSGDPDDNGTLDRLKELVAAINENKDNIDKILDIANSGTGIAFVADAAEEPEYSGKIRMIVSNMPDHSASSDEEGEIDGQDQVAE